MSDRQYSHHDDQTRLETALRSTQPWLEANLTFLICGFAAVRAVAAGIVWYQRQPEANAEVSAQWMDARQPEDFQNIADTHDNSPLGRLARLSLADSLINNGSRSIFSDREAADADFELADAALSRLTDSSELGDNERQRVLMSQARLAEIRGDGSDESIQAAIAAWQKILDQFEEPFAKEYVEGRIEELGKPGVGTFYAWFHEFDPKPQDDLNLPGLGLGLEPGPGSAVPDIPSLTDEPDPLESAQGTADDTAGTEDSTEPETTEDVRTEESATEESSEEPASQSESGSADSPSNEPSGEAVQSESTESTSSDSSESPQEETPAEPAE